MYHARFLLLRRSVIEYLLDGAFNRRGDVDWAVAEPSSMRALIQPLAALPSSMLHRQLRNRRRC